jgi:hypothetical protein
MKTWANAIEQNKQLTTILRARLELLNKEAMIVMLEATGAAVKDKWVKIGAINTALKITVEQIKLSQELGLIERKPVEIKSTNRNLTIIRMWQPDNECDPAKQNVSLGDTGKHS